MLVKIADAIDSFLFGKQTMTSVSHVKPAVGIRVIPNGRCLGLVTNQDHPDEK